MYSALTSTGTYSPSRFSSVWEKVPFPQETIKGGRQARIRFDELEMRRHDPVEGHVLFGNLPMDMFLFGGKLIQVRREAVQQDGVQGLFRLQAAEDAKHIAESGPQHAVSGRGNNRHIHLRIGQGGVFISGTGLLRRPDGDAPTAGLRGRLQHRLDRRQDQRLAAGHLEEGVDVELAILRQEGVRQDEHLRTRLPEAGHRIESVGICN